MHDDSQPVTSSTPCSSRATSNTATRNTIPAMNSMYPPVKAFVIDDETKPLATWLGLSPRVTLVSNTAPTEVRTTEPRIIQPAASHKLRVEAVTADIPRRDRWTAPASSRRRRPHPDRRSSHDPTYSARPCRA